MRALILSDLHGHYTNIKDLIVDADPDLIILTGDIPTSIDIPVLIYSYIKGRRKEYIRQIYSRFNERLSYRQIRTARRILIQLTEFNIPVVFIHGNTELKSTRNWLELFAHRFANLHYIADSAVEIKNKLFIGHGYTAVPSDYKRERTPGEIDIDEDYSKLTNTINNAIKAHPKSKDIILISHSPPLNTSVDYLSHKQYHAGSVNVRKVLDDGIVSKVVSGHLHEAFGTHRTDSWWAVNAGSVLENVACTIDLNTGKTMWYTGFHNKFSLSSILYSSRNKLR